MDNLVDRALVHLEFCNNIISCDIGIATGALNIKYAINGTGKSTLAKAISLVSQGHSLSSLRPFVFPAGTPDTAQPSADGVIFSKVMLFDSEYVRQYIFLPTELIKDAFEIFIRTPNYDETKEKIEYDYNTVLKWFSDSETMRNLSSILRELKSLFATNTDGAFSRKTKGVKSILDQKKCSLEAPPEDLLEFKPFFEDNSLAVDWAAWKLIGIEKYAYRGICPFCAIVESAALIDQTRLFSESFDKESILLTSKLFSCLDKMSQLIDPAKLGNLKFLLSKDGNRATLDVELRKLLAEASYILQQVETLESFNGLTIKRDQIGQLVPFLEARKIDVSSFDYFNTTQLREDLNILNNKIDEVIQTINILQQNIADLHSCLIKQLSIKTKDINEFLKSAGFKYSFNINIDSDGIAHALLLFKATDDNLVQVNDPASHLSWGEKNAFSLLLFMFDAIHKNADLIILDDPISSFDSSKKYAIINRLFMTGNRDNSLYMRTVLLLTHDMEPVIDYIQVGGKLDESHVNGYYMQNVDGILAEFPLRKNIDILSTLILLIRTAKDPGIALPARIGCLRKYIEHTVDNPSAKSMSYNILSSLIHGRDYATYDNVGALDMDPVDYQKGLSEIIDFIPEFDYSAILEQYKARALLEEYNRTTNRYIQLLVLRAYIQRYEEARVRLKSKNDVLRKFVDETFHIENDYIYSFDFMAFAVVPDFINISASDFVRAELMLLKE